MARSKDFDKAREAQKLRAEGVRYREIATRLGVGIGTVHRWCNPDSAARDRETSLRWKRDNLERKRARDRAYSRKRRSAA